MTTTTKPSRVDFIAAAMEYSLHWKTSITREVQQSLFDHGSDPKPLREALDAVGCYNNFDPFKVARVLQDFGDRMMGVDLGRECSPVLYITIPCWSQQCLGYRGKVSEPLPQASREAMAGAVLRAFLACPCPPDELSVEACHISKPEPMDRAWVPNAFKIPEAVKDRQSITIRAWWD